MDDKQALRSLAAELTIERALVDCLVQVLDASEALRKADLIARLEQVAEANERGGRLALAAALRARAERIGHPPSRLAMLD